MEQDGNKVSWVIKDFNSLQVRSIQSDEFVVGGCRWSLMVYPHGKNRDNKVSLFLLVSNYETLTPGWKIQPKFSVSALNHSTQDMLHGVGTGWLNGEYPMCGFAEWLHRGHLNNGFLVNGDLKIFAEVEVLDKVGDFSTTPRLDMRRTLCKVKISGCSPIRVKVNLSGNQEKRSDLQVSMTFLK